MMFSHLSAKLVATIALLLCLNGTSVVAEPTKKDVLVASRALNFINPKPSGTVVAAIVFDPANTTSQAHANALQSIIGGGLKAGKVKLSAKMVPISSLADMDGSAIAFITEGLGAQQSSISAATAGKSVLLASTDLSCVQSGNCALGVSTSPKVEIYVNQGAATSAGLTFLPAFLMMVKEV